VRGAFKTHSNAPKASLKCGVPIDGDQRVDLDARHEGSIKVRRRSRSWIASRNSLPLAIFPSRSWNKKL
jgi:hypothetical protein